MGTPPGARFGRAQVLRPETCGDYMSAGRGAEAAVRAAIPVLDHVPLCPAISNHLTPFLAYSIRPGSPKIR
jgi:hypothetical protein